MKKIINSIIISSILLNSCQSSSNKETKSIQEPAIQQIVGVGKVLPQDGIIMLSIAQANTVEKIYKKLGDTVRKGDKILALKATNESLAIDQAKAAKATTQSQAAVTEVDIQRARIKLAELQQQWQTSQQLKAKNAETAEKVFQDSIAYAEQKLIVNQQQQQYQSQLQQVKEKDIAINIQKNNLSDQFYVAPYDGILISFNVQLGETLSPNTTFGELAPNQPLVIEGELDEFYADKLQLGKKVDISLVGQSQTIASGSISFVGNSLQNKSILYESVGEAQDRRVRRFTVKIDQGQEKLLINQKVSCKIQL